MLLLWNVQQHVLQIRLPECLELARLEVCQVDAIDARAEGPPVIEVLQDSHRQR